MMKKLYLEDIVSLLKVFDGDFMSESEYSKICDLNINQKIDQMKAINFLVVPEFRSFTDAEKVRMKDTLQYYLNIKSTKFNHVFERISFIFDENIEDQREFMVSIWECLFTNEFYENLEEK